MMSTRLKFTYSLVLAGRGLRALCRFVGTKVAHSSLALAKRPFRAQLWRVPLLLSLLLGGVLTGAKFAAAYTANKVWFEFHPGGLYRVYVSYTVPELKELRESYVEFRKKREAERFYWDLVRGADFFPPDPTRRRFVNEELKPEPW